MKIIIRYLEIYIYIQDLRIYDINKNSITTKANRIFILNKSYGNRTFYTNLHSQKFNVSALILSVSVFKLSTFETSKPQSATNASCLEPYCKHSSSDRK